jgi:hypothetical protein
MYVCICEYTYMCDVLFVFILHLYVYFSPVFLSFLSSVPFSCFSSCPLCPCSFLPFFLEFLCNYFALSKTIPYFITTKVSYVLPPLISLSQPHPSRLILHSPVPILSFDPPLPLAVFPPVQPRTFPQLPHNCSGSSHPLLVF